MRPQDRSPGRILGPLAITAEYRAGDSLQQLSFTPDFSTTNTIGQVPVLEQSDGTKLMPDNRFGWSALRNGGHTSQSISTSDVRERRDTVIWTARPPAGSRTRDSPH